jgi:hypothetical protein
MFIRRLYFSNRCTNKLLTYKYEPQYIPAVSSARFLAVIEAFGKRVAKSSASGGGFNRPQVAD